MRRSFGFVGRPFDAYVSTVAMSRDEVADAHSEYVDEQGCADGIIVEARVAPLLTTDAASVLLRLLRDAATDGAIHQVDDETHRDGEALRVAS